MAINLIPTGKPCEICKTPARNALDGTVPDALHIGVGHLEPREENIVDEHVVVMGTVTVGDGYLGTAPDKQVYRVERDKKDIGTYCAKCLRAACEAAVGSGQVGADVIIAMREQALGT